MNDNIRKFLNEAVQRKTFLMFSACIFYILGLWAFFANLSIVIGVILFIAGCFLIFKNFVSSKIILFWYFIFIFAFFNASFRMKFTDDLQQYAPSNAVISGQIVSIPNVINGKTKFYFKVDNIKYDGLSKNVEAKTLVSFSQNDGVKLDDKLNIGNYYQFEGRLKKPYPASNPSQFDYGKYLRNFDTFTLFYSENGKFINNPNSIKWKFIQQLNNIRKDIIKKHSICLKSPNIELLGGMVFGDDAIAPTEDLKVSFQHSGLLHLLAASGMNVALIYGIWFFILRKLRVPYNISILSGIFVVIFYSLMTGLGASVVRATFMLVFILIGKLLDRQADSVSLLAFVGLLMLIYNPAYINDVGFQLSFLVTFGLLVMSEPVMSKMACVPNWLSGAIFIPLIAQIWVAPIQMYYFNSFSLYSIFANILILPFVTIISFGGFISSVFAIFNPLNVCSIFDIALNPILNIVVWISDYFSNLPHSLVQMPQPSILQILIYYLLVLSVVFILKNDDKFNKFYLRNLVILLVFALIFSCVKFPNTNFETIAFDVQNADAFLIKTPKNKYFIIDTGKSAYKQGKSQAEIIILSYLKDKGIKNIEGLILSHFDSDHAGGACDLMYNLNIKYVYVNSINDSSNIAQKIYKISKKQNINQLVLIENTKEIYREGKFSITNFVNKGASDNEKSMITLVSNANFDELFMGDAGINAFEKLKDLPEKIEILKVGHHGAKNVINNDMIKRLKSDVAIISTGINHYGHPNGITLDVLNHNGVKILRTDRQNSIKIVEKNSKYNLFGYYNNKYVELN